MKLEIILVSQTGFYSLLQLFACLERVNDKIPHPQQEDGGPVDENTTSGVEIQNVSEVMGPTGKVYKKNKTKQ